MKKHFTSLMFLILLFHGCKAQTILNKDIMIPEINNQFEKFDIESFEKEADSISGKKILITDFHYSEKEGQSPGYIERIYFNDSYFMLTKKFFQNGNIQEKAVSFNNGYPIGMWYQFNEVGELTHEVNTDEGYDFGYEQIVNYCKKNEIPLTKGYSDSGFQTTIYKNEDKINQKTWQITYQAGSEKLLEVTLDGKTGKEIGRKEIEFVNK